MAVVVQLLNGWYSSHVVAGVEAVCAEAGYDTIVIGVGPGSRDRDVFSGSSAMSIRDEPKKAACHASERISPALAVRWWR